MTIRAAALTVDGSGADRRLTQSAIRPTAPVRAGAGAADRGAATTLRPPPGKRADHTGSRHRSGRDSSTGEKDSRADNNRSRSDRRRVEHRSRSRTDRDKREQTIESKAEERERNTSEAFSFTGRKSRRSSETQNTGGKSRSAGSYEAQSGAEQIGNATPGSGRPYPPTIEGSDPRRSNRAPLFAYTETNFYRGV